MELVDIYEKIKAKIERNEKRCSSLKSDLMVGDVVSPEKTRALIEYLEWDTFELKDWVYEIEKYLAKVESNSLVNQVQEGANNSSWNGQVDRQGGAFDENELRGRDGWS